MNARRNESFRKHLSRKSIVTSMLVAVVVALFGYMAYTIVRNRHEDQKNDKYFLALKESTESYYSVQSAVLGLESSPHDMYKICYQSEQGPWDNGRLWCSIGAKKDIVLERSSQVTIQLNIKNLLQKAIEAAKETSFDGVYQFPKNLEQSFSFIIEKRGLGTETCSLALDYQPTGGSEGAQDIVSYEISCANRARKVPPGFQYRP